jgi:hypothetical protein
MLMPKHESTEPLVRSLTEDPHHSRMILMLDITLSALQVPKATILVVDRKNSVVMELGMTQRLLSTKQLGFQLILIRIIQIPAKSVLQYAYSMPYLAG